MPRGVDRPAAGTGAARAAAPPHPAGAAAHPAGQPDPRHRRRHGYDRPAGYWSGPGQAWLASLDLPLIDALADPITALDAQVRQRARTEPGVRVLTQLRGAGEFTALVILAGTGDITRFGSARKLAAWAGLTPTVRSSDRTVRHGRISKQGSAWLRWALGQAAQTAKRHPGFSATYAAIAARRGKQIATTAIAARHLHQPHPLAGIGPDPGRDPPVTTRWSSPITTVTSYSIAPPPRACRRPAAVRSRPPHRPWAAGRPRRYRRRS